MLVFEADQQGQQGVPGFAAFGDHPESADIVTRGVLEGVLGHDRPGVLQGIEVGAQVQGSLAEDQGVLAENEKVPTESRGHEVEIHLDDLLCGGGDVRFDQDLEPKAKAIRVEEVLVAALVAAPQVVVEDAHQLFAGGEGDDLAAVFETAMSNELVEDSRFETRDHLGELGRVEDPRKKMTIPSCFERALGHLERPPGAGYHGALRRNYIFFSLLRQFSLDFPFRFGYSVRSWSGTIPRS